MTFDIKDKVALVTGGAAGLGFSFVKELLKNGVKGITIADIDRDTSIKALQQIENEFGCETIQFVHTDVTQKKQFENAFMKTIEKFGGVDILINNAGKFKDGLWEEEISTNVIGTLNGIILGFHSYLTKHKQGSEAVIVNVSSIGALQPMGDRPVYAGSKLASLAFTRNWGNPDIYDLAKIKVVAICPGATESPGIKDIINKMSQSFMPGIYSDIRMKKARSVVLQKSDIVASEAIRIIKYATTGSIWVVENSESAYQYILPVRSTMKNNLLIEN